MQFYLDRHKQSFVWQAADFKTYMVIIGDHLKYLEFLSVFLDGLRRESEYVGEDYGVVRGAEESGYGSDRGDDASEESGSDEAYSYRDGGSSYRDDSNEVYSYDTAHRDGKSSYRDDSAVCNSLLYTNKDRAFVARGDTIGVFSTSDRLKFNHAIKNVAGTKRKILMYENKDLILLDDDKRREINFLDLERGKVVERIRMGEDVNDVMVRKNEIVGVNDNSLFMLDRRIDMGGGRGVDTARNTRTGRSGRGVDTGRTARTGRNDDSITDFSDGSNVVNFHTYKTKTFFTKSATDDTHSAIGNKKGDLRIYSDIMKRAKVLITGLGDEIKHIDIGNSWVVLTFNQYLILFKIQYRKDDRRTIRLSLKPEHTAFLRHRVCFNRAKFNESHTDIVTSTGQYLVTWRIRDVERGDVFMYRMKDYGTDIVDDSFVGEDKVLVTLKNDLKMLRKKSIG